MARARNCSVSSSIPKVTTACGNHNGVSLDVDSCPRVKDAAGELDHRRGQERHEDEAGERREDLERTPDRRRHVLQQQHDTDMAADTQRHGRAEGEGGRHQIGGILPGDRDGRRKERQEVRQQTRRDLGKHQRRQRQQAAAADPAVEPAEAIDRVEQDAQRRRRRRVEAFRRQQAGRSPRPRS